MEKGTQERLYNHCEEKVLEKEIKDNFNNTVGDLYNRCEKRCINNNNNNNNNKNTLEGL